MLALQVHAKAIVKDILQGEYDDDLSDTELDVDISVQPSQTVEPETRMPSPPPVQTEARMPSLPPVKPLEETAPATFTSVQESLPEMPLSSVAEALESMTELEPVEPLQTAQPSSDKAAHKIVSPVLQERSPPTSPTAHLESTAPVTTFLPPPIFAESEVSSPGSNQLALFEAGMKSPIRPEVTNEKLRTAINNLFIMLQRSPITSGDSAQAISSLRQSFMDEINSLCREIVRQSSTATVVVNLSGQLARTEQWLEAKIDSLGTQLTKIIFFLASADDKNGEEEAEPGRSAKDEPRRSSSTDEERYKRKLEEERQRQQAKRHSGSGSGARWFKR